MGWVHTSPPSKLLYHLGIGTGRGNPHNTRPLCPMCTHAALVSCAPAGHPRMQHPRWTPKQTPRSSPEPHHPHLKTTRTPTCRPLPSTDLNLRPRAPSIHL